MPVAFESIEQASRSGSEAVQRLLQGEQETSREVRVENARAALAMLDAELKDLGRAEKKNIIEGSRVILQSALESTTQEIRAAADERLESLAEDQRTNLEAQRLLLQRELKKIEDIRGRALELQRELEDSFAESAGNAARETLNDFRNITPTQAVMYGAAGLGIGAIGYKIGKWIFGTKEKPTFLRRTFAFLGGLLGVAAGAVGLKMIQDRLPKIPTATDAVDAVKNEAYNGLAYLNNNFGPGAFSDDYRMTPSSNDPLERRENTNLPPHERLKQLVAEGSYLKAFIHSISNGGGLIMNGGEASLHVKDGEPVSITPEALQQIKEYSDSAEAASSGGWVMLYLEGGAIYLVSRAVFGLILYGKNPLPPTLKGKILSVAKVGIGPLIAGKDAARYASYLFTPRGKEQLQVLFVTESLPARTMRSFTNWRRRLWFQSDISNEKGVLETIRRRMEMKNVVEVLEIAGQRGSDGRPRKGSELELAAAELAYLDSRVKAGLNVLGAQVAKGKPVSDPKLSQMVAERDRHSQYDHNMQTLFGHMQADTSAPDPEPTATPSPAAQPSPSPAPAETQAQTEAPAGPSPEQERIAELESQVQAQIEQIAELQTQAANNPSIAELQTQLADLQKQLAAERESFQQQLAAENGHGQAMRDYIDTIEQQLFIESNRAKLSADEVTRLESELAALRTQFSQMSAAYETNVEAAAKRAEAHAEELAQMQSQIDEGTAARTALEEELRQAKAQAAHYRDQYEAAQEQVQDLSSSPVERSSQSGRTNPDDGPASTPAENPAGDRNDPNGPAAEETPTNPKRRPIRPKPGLGAVRKIEPESAARQRSAFEGSGLNRGDRFNPNGKNTDTDTDTGVKAGRR